MPAHPAPTPPALTLDLHEPADQVGGERGVLALGRVRDVACDAEQQSAVAAVALTALDTLLVLWLEKLGIRYFEAFILGLIAVIAICFAIELFMAKPEAAGVLGGLFRWLDNRSLYVAIGMLGATVMPHNLYLHSALVQTRHIGHTDRQEARRM